MHACLGVCAQINDWLQRSRMQLLDVLAKNIPEADDEKATATRVYPRRGRARRRRSECVYGRVFLAGPRARARRSGHLVSYAGAPEEGRDAGPMKGGLPLPSNVSGRDRFGRGVRAPVLLKGRARALRPRTGPNRDREDH